MRIKPSQGFSLIELMVVVTLVAILSLVAYPMYDQQRQSSYRSQAKTALLRAAQQQERHYTEKNQYTSANDFPTLFGLTEGMAVYSNPDAPNDAHSRYQVTYAPQLNGAHVVGYQMSATPLGWNDPICGTLTLNHVGIRQINLGGSTGSVEQVKQCWGK